MMQWHYDADRRFLESTGLLALARTGRRRFYSAWAWTGERPFPFRWPVWLLIAVPSGCVLVLWGLANFALRYEDSPDNDYGY